MVTILLDNHQGYYYHINRSWEYKDIKPKILCEEFISSINKASLDDYKIHCFNGEPKYIQHIFGRHEGGAKHKFYNLNWEAQEFNFTNPMYEKTYPKPAGLENMLEIARKLSKDWIYARIDLYNIEGKIYFGEITFHPVNGMDDFFPREYNKIWGNMLDLKNKN